MRKILFLVMAVLYANTMLAQNNVETVEAPGSNQVTIGAVDVTHKSSDFKIMYKIRLGKNVRSCNVNLKISNDGGRNFNITPSPGSVTGHVGKIARGGDKTIYYNVSQDKSMLIDKDVVFEVNVSNMDVLKMRTFILAQGQISLTSSNSFNGGAMLGFCRTEGAYIKVTSSFTQAPETQFVCEKDGRILDGNGHLTNNYFWSDGTSSSSSFSATGGLLFRASKILYPYVGAGYGYDCCYWRDTGGNWAEVSDYSCKSIAADLGLLLNFGHFSLNTGVSTIGFKTLYVSAGLGVSF